MRKVAAGSLVDLVHNVSTTLYNPRAEDTLDRLDRRGAPHDRFDFFKTGSVELKRRDRMRELISFER